MKIILNQRTERLRADRHRLIGLTRYLMRRATSRTDPGRWACVSLLLADDREMARWNAAAFGHPEPTDVISYAYPPALPGEPGWTGEIAVNAARARRFGPRHRGPAFELALYVAHGCDHLCGGDDATPAGRRLMRRRELRWLAGAARRGLLEDLLPGERP